MTLVQELKPCPFCGSSDLNTHEPDHNPAHESWVVCADCGASSGLRNSEQKAEKAWNRRAFADTLEGEEIIWEIIEAFEASDDATSNDHEFIETYARYAKAALAAVRGRVG